MSAPTFLEFFCGGGMAREGLGPSWSCLFANDIDPMKGAAYTMFRRDRLRVGDVSRLTLADLPATTADLAWASFPCQDLSLAGGGKGLDGSRSGIVWQFFRLMGGLRQAGRAPRIIVLENVVGWLTSHGGKDFGAIVAALSEIGYRSGAVVIDAALFVPQSRERVFVVAVRNDMALPAVTADAPQANWHPAALIRAVEPEAKRDWIWWRLPKLAPRRQVFSDLIEETPTGIAWHTAAQSSHILELMPPLHHQKIEDAWRSSRRVIGAVYRRTRPDVGCGKQQRAEVRFDDVAGCLRVPTGGSSRQTILVVEGRDRLRSLLLSPREAARLMGLKESYKLPGQYNDAYAVCGEGVVAPVVSFLECHLLSPILNSQSAVLSELTLDGAIANGPEERS